MNGRQSRRGGVPLNKRAKGESQKLRRQRPQVEELESRELLTGTWNTLAPTNPDAGPTNTQALMLLSDGTVMVQGGSNAATTSWFKLSPTPQGSYLGGTWSALASMNTGRLFFTSAVLPDGRVFVVGGEFSTPFDFTNTAEIYDPVANTWTGVSSVPTPNTQVGANPPPTARSQYGDDPIEVLPSGQILAGYFNSSTTYRYDPGSDTWTTTTGSKLHNDASDEESWVKLPDGSILSYDVFGSVADGKFEAQRYIPSTDTWVDASTLSATNPPSILSGPNQGSELGPGFLMPNGQVIYFGANGSTAIYDPSTDIWTAGPLEPTQMINGVNTQLAATDDPGAVLPNGHILISFSPLGGLNAKNAYNFPTPSFVYEFDPGSLTDPNTQAFADVTPAGLGNENAFRLNMVVLPTGQVLMGNSAGSIQLYSPDGSAQSAWQPTITNITHSGNSFLLTGTQLNGMSEGALYGDDFESASNYPIVRYIDQNGNVLYGRTSNWSSVGVQTGTTAETTNFALPNGPGPGVYLAQVSASGLVGSVLDIMTTGSADTYNLQVDPNDSTSFQVFRDGSLWAEWPIIFSRIIVTGTNSGETVDINSTPAGVPVTVSDVNTVNVGMNGSVQNIASDITIGNAPALTALNVDDSADTTGRSITFNTVSIPTDPDSYGQISGLAPGNINYEYNDTSSVTVMTGIGGNALDVEATGSPLTVNLAAMDNPTVKVCGTGQNLSTITSPLTINGAGAGSIEFDDQAFPDILGANYTMTASSISRAHFNDPTTGTTALMQYMGFNNITVNGPNVVSEYMVQGTEVGGATTINTGSEFLDGVDVQSTSGSLTANLGKGAHFVNISTNTHLLDSIQGDVTVNNNQGGATELNIDDQGYTDIGGANYTMDGHGVSRTHFNDPTTGTTAHIYYVSVNTINLYGANAVSQYTVQGTEAAGATTISTGNEFLDGVNVQSTSGSLTVNLGKGAHFVNIGSSTNLLDTIQGDVTVNNNQGGGTELNINDQGNTDSGGAAYTMDGAAVSRTHLNDPTTGTTAHIRYNAVNTINLYGANTTSRYAVQNTESGGTTKIASFTGNDTFNIEATTGPLIVYLAGSGNPTVNLSPTAQNLDNIQGNVSVNGSGFGTVNLDDQSGPSSNMDVLDAKKFSRVNFGGLSYGGLAGLVINAAAGNPLPSYRSTQNVFVVGTPAGTTTLINAANGANDIIVGLPTDPTLNTTGLPGSPLENIQGPVTVTGDNQDNMTLWDWDSTTAQKTYTINSNSISPAIVGGAASATISWQGYFSTVALFGSFAADTYVLQSAPNDLAALVVNGAYRTNTFQSLLPDRHTWLMYSNGTVTTALAPGRYAIFGEVWNFTGGPAGDDFQFQPNYGVNGKLDGVLNGNGGTLDYSQDSSPITVNLANNSASNIDGGLANGFSNIVSVIGNNSSTTLAGPNQLDYWNITGSNQGNLLATQQYQQGPFTFSQVPNLTGGANNDDFQFAGGAAVSGIVDGAGGTNTLDYYQYATGVNVNLAGQDQFPGNGPETFDGQGSATGTAGEYHIQNVISSEFSSTLIGDDEANTFVVVGLPTAPPVDLLVGNGGDDVFRLEGVIGSRSQVYGGTYDLRTHRHAEAGNDLLWASDLTNTWDLTGGDSGMVTSAYQGVNYRVTFANCENLLGGLGDDRFRFHSGANFTGYVNGNYGNNTLDYTSYGSPVTVNLGALPVQRATATGYIVGFRNFIGSTATNSFQALNQTGTWQLSSTSAGTITYSPANAPLIYSFRRFTQLIGSGSDTLIGPNTTNTWVINAVNGGTLNGQTSLSGFPNLVGGTGVDTFQMQPTGQVAGILGGGAPARRGDWLDYSAFSTPVVVNLATGSATQVNGGSAGAIGGIQNVLGGQGGNTLTGNALGNILVGGSGTDLITGGSGRSLLIGDGGGDIIQGGSGQDILIGGTTSWDSSSDANRAALMAILAEWQSRSSYALRVEHLRGQAPGGLNGSNLLTWGTTVLDDSSATVHNQLTAAASPLALDWFFVGAFDSYQNYETGEAFNNSNHP